MTEKVTVATATALASNFYKRLRDCGEPDLAGAQIATVLRPDL